MPVLESTQAVPLDVSEDGTMRIGGTRVSLDSVLQHYQQGATAEEIALRFPALRLADIHSCLAYFLNHPDQVEQYLDQRRQHADGLTAQHPISLPSVRLCSPGPGLAAGC
jgi:uncharacterized protein (DUF433 family)